LLIYYPNLSNNQSPIIFNHYLTTYLCPGKENDNLNGNTYILPKVKLPNSDCTEPQAMYEARVSAFLQTFYERRAGFVVSFGKDTFVCSIDKETEK
jgi:hypothetical protein